jgi:branched-chain amino acid transport system substrate-binding protein
MSIRRLARKPMIAGGLCAILTLIVAGCKPSGGESPAASGDTIRVGEYGSITGSEAAFGKTTDDGIRLAADELNAAGGLNGKKFEIIGPEDTASVQQQGEIAVKRLLEKKVVAVLGEVASGISMAGGPVCQSNQVPMISPSSTNPDVTKVGDFVFRVCFIDPYQAGVLAKFSVDTLKAKTAAIMFDAGAPYSVGIHDEFKRSFEKRGGKIVSEVGFSKEDKDFKSQLTKVKSANPDVIVVGSYYQQGGTILKQARDLGITVPLLGGDGWDNAEFHTYAGNKVGNAYMSTHASMDDPAPTIQNFVKAFEAKYGHKPDALAALGYDSMKVLADAMKRAKSLSGSDLRDAIAATKDFDGVTGKITINANRDAEKGAVILEIANGAFKFKESIAKEALAGQ